MIDFKVALKECERTLLTNGITTMFHSLSLYNKQLFGVKEIRKPENVKRLIVAINAMQDSDHLIRHKVHARLELDNLQMVDIVEEMIKNGEIHLLSYMDHTPGQGQYRDIEMYKKTLRGHNPMPQAEFEELLRKNLEQSEMISLEKMTKLAQCAREHHIALASHDDDNVEKLELMQDLGATISEFPITMDIAQEARRMGFWTLAGAPNILLGGSHTGNLNAADGILENNIKILCSDYYPSAMVLSAFIMYRKHGVPLPEMIQKLTINPAKAVFMDDQVGSIAPGKKADLLIIMEKDHYPAITFAMVDGKISYRTQYRPPSVKSAEQTKEQEEKEDTSVRTMTEALLRP